MVLWIVVVFQISCLCVSASINLTYILKREKTNWQPSCIAEELERYAAVGWVYPMPTAGAGIPNTTYKYIPYTQNDYNCKFSKNEKCNMRWTVKDWNIDDSSSRTRELLKDSRWEALPTILISNYTKEFENRFHIETAHKNGFSVRASGTVELFICTGWNPYNYPCYYFIISKREISLKKYSVLQEVSDNSLKSYKAFSNILSDDEWRNFEVSVDETGRILLVDINLNRTVIEHIDNEPLKPMYLLMRSIEPSLWKISENQFMYTETAQISRMGPQIHITYKDLCVSLFVGTCSNCQMTFFYLNGTQKKILKYVGPLDNNWTEVKLKQENILLSKVNIFVETEFVDKSISQNKGWWAYDEVRICNENEVKVTFLKLNETIAEDDLTVNKISCQLIKKPSWRPQKLEYDEIEDFPKVDIFVNDTSIKLSWKQEDPDNYLNYFIFYQGNDLCSSDFATSKRLKSSGFLTTKHNEIMIKDLIPYTLYNVTISSVLHENDKLIKIKTLQTEQPLLEELPLKIHIRPLDTAVNVSWDKPSCNSMYGSLIFTLLVSNEKMGFNKSVDLSTENVHFIDGLVPYTNYSLVVLTARNAKNLNSMVHTSKLMYSFSTLAGVAPPVKNLEIYAIGANVAHLRYDLPTNPVGVPTEVQVTRCNKLSFAKCKASISKIEKCHIWKEKYCLDIQYLMPNQEYLFKASIKNTNTNSFGKETVVNGYTVERVPTPPENITYRVVDCQELTDYCHLNISWRHPYYPNATISSFNIILNSTYFNSSYSEEDQTIQEVYKIVNNTYLETYTYQVKYVPYSKEYDLYLQSANSKYKSTFATTRIKTADLGDHIDQKPALLGKGDKALVFKLPHLDRRLNSYVLTVGVQDYNESVPVDIDSISNKKLENNLCHLYGNIWTSQVLKVEDNETKTVTVAGLDETRTIKPNTKYCIIFIVTNNYRGAEHDVVYYEKLTTANVPEPPKDLAKPSSFNHLYILLVLLLLVPIGFLLFRYLKKRKLRKRQQANEHQYESLPFEQHENFANNRTYDHLIHK